MGRRVRLLLFALSCAVLAVLPACSLFESDDDYLVSGSDEYFERALQAYDGGLTEYHAIAGITFGADLFAVNAVLYREWLPLPRAGRSDSTWPNETGGQSVSIWSIDGERVAAFDPDSMLAGSRSGEGLWYRGIALTRDDQYVICTGVSSIGGAGVWRIADGELVTLLPGMDGSVSVTHNGSELFGTATYTDETNHEQTVIRRWDTSDWTLIDTLDARLPIGGYNPRAGGSILLSSNDSLLVLGSSRDPWLVWNTRSGERLSGGLESVGDPLGFAGAPQELLLAQCGVHFVRPIDGAVLRTVEISGYGPVYDLDAPGRAFVSGDEQGVIAVHRLPDGEQLHLLSTNGQQITALTISPDNEYIVTGHRGGSVCITRMPPLD